MEWRVNVWDQIGFGEGVGIFIRVSIVILPVESGKKRIENVGHAGGEAGWK